MLLRQLFDRESSTYTYLLADKPGGQACLIDPVQEQMPSYLTLLEQLELELVFACDTHIHADHITALGALKQETACATYVGTPGEVNCASNGLQHGDRLVFGDAQLEAIFTPGHTDSSFCFLLQSSGQTFLFSGDTLLIRGCGRTDFQNGDAQQMYHSLHDTLLTLDDNTVVYPAHDYKGWTVSRIGEERAFNPRLQIASCEAFVEHMQNLDLPDPKMMDIAVPRNMSCGKAGTIQ
ncbi:MAG: MBL fold metallo-hydrolase [Pseudomonadales bacterium]|nr:MBL fold metallo-hydrolase [Pseudomonadales bacterium]